MQARHSREPGQREQRDPLKDHAAGAVPAATGRRLWKLAES